MTTIAEAIANPLAYGFKFNMEPVSRTEGNTKVEVGTGPIVVLTDIVKFEAAFPGVILRRSDSSSPRVMSQGAVRRTLIKNRKASLASLQELSLSAVIGGTRGRAETPVYLEREVWDVMSEEAQDRFLARNAGKKLVLTDEDGVPEPEAEEDEVAE